MAKKLLRFVRDAVKPTLSTVTFSSDNSDTTLAVVGDVVTLAFVPSEVINSLVVTIAWKNVTPTQISPLSYTASYTMTSGDTAWVVPFTIDFKDINGVSGTRVTATTGKETVTFSKAPVMLSASRQSNTVLFVTLSKNADDATLTQANDGGFVVKETGNTEIVYAVSATAKQGSNSNIVELTVADMTASAAAWVTVTYSSTGNGIIADADGNEMATDTVGVAAAAWA